MPSSQCSVCRHPDLVDITTALLQGSSHRSVARAFGLSPSAIDRHQANGHTSALLSQSTQRVEAIEPEALLGAVATLYERALDALTQAERGTDGRLRIAALGEVRQCIGLLAQAASAVPVVPEESTALDIDQAIRDALGARGAAAHEETADVPSSEREARAPLALPAGRPLEGEGVGG